MEEIGLNFFLRATLLMTGQLFLMMQRMISGLLLAKTLDIPFKLMHDSSCV